MHHKHPTVALVSVLPRQHKLRGLKLCPTDLQEHVQCTRRRVTNQIIFYHYYDYFSLFLIPPPPLFIVVNGGMGVGFSVQKYR